MQYIVEKPVGKFGKGAHVSHEDFINDKDPSTNARAEELESRGILTRIDGDYAEPRTDDLAGWKRRCQVLAADLKSLRTGGGSPEILAHNQELEKENEGLKADVSQLQTMNADLSQGVVKKADYDNLNDQLAQSKLLQETTQKALDELKLEHETLSGDYETLKAADPKAGK